MSRELSCFIAQELIGLSHFKALDEARSSALKHHLQTCANCQRFSGRCEAGLQVASVLKEVMPSQSLIAFVGQDHSFAKNVAKKYSWKNWPMGLRWASELMALAVVLVIVVEIFPWRKVINRLESPGAHPVNGVAAVAVAESPTQEPEMKGVVVQTKYPSPSPEAKPTPAPQVALAKTDLKAAAESMEGEAEAMPTPTKVQKVTQGSLFRADMTVTKPLGETDTVRIAIEGLGGEKAGQVSLGRRKESGRYYHFTLPEKNYDALLSQLKAIGDLRIHRESHPRVMPEGLIRIILSLEEPSGESEQSVPP